jgi:hypothetical protein
VDCAVKLPDRNDKEKQDPVCADVSADHAYSPFIDTDLSLNRRSGKVANAIHPPSASITLSVKTSTGVCR